MVEGTSNAVSVRGIYRLVLVPGFGGHFHTWAWGVMGVWFFFPVCVVEGLDEMMDQPNPCAARILLQRQKFGHCILECLWNGLLLQCWGKNIVA